MDMSEKNYAALNKSLIITDLFDLAPEPSVLTGVAIRAKDLDAFLVAVERLAREEFGGASFDDIIEFDENDFVAELSALRFRRDRAADIADSAEEILRRAAEGKRDTE